MRVIIILAAIALTHGAKLERAYLPPSSANSAGGSGNFLQTPISGPGRAGSARNYQNTPLGNNYSQSGNGFTQSGNDFAQSGNDFAQSGNDFAPSGIFAQTGAEYNNVNYNNFAQESRPERPRAAFERNAAILRQDNSNDGESFSYAFETENGIYAEEHGVATNGVEAQGGYSYTGDDGQVYSIRYTADQNGFVPQGDHLPTPPPVPEEILKALEQNARDEANGIYDDGSYNEGKYDGADNSQYNQNAYGNNDDAVITNSAFRSTNARAFNGPSNAYLAPKIQGANPDVTSFDAPASNYGTPEARSFNANARGANAPAVTYGAPNAPTFNAPASTYGAPEARSFNANARGGNAPAVTYGAPSAPSFNANARSANAPSSTYGAPNAPSFNAPIANAGVARNSATEKAYLPPLASQRGQARNAFGRRQSFNEKTGYNY